MHNSADVFTEAFDGWVDLIVKDILVGFVLLEHKLVLHLGPTGSHDKLLDILIIKQH